MSYEGLCICCGLCVSEGHNTQSLLTSELLCLVFFFLINNSVTFGYVTMKVGALCLEISADNPSPNDILAPFKEL